MTTVPDQSNHSLTLKRALVAVAAALGMGLVFDILFFGKMPGISFPIYTGLTLIALIVAGLRQRRDLPKQALYLIPPILFFSSMVYLRASEFLTFLNVVMTLYLLGLFVSLVLRPKLFNYGFGDYLVLMLKLPLRVLGKIGDVLRPLMSQLGIVSKRGEMRHLTRGVLITLPVLLLFAALFSSADLVFRGFVDDLFNFQISSDVFWHLFWILSVTAVFLGLFGLLAAKPGDSEHELGTKPAAGRFGLVESSIMLGSLNVLFLIFIAIQVTYLFGGTANVVGGDFTYAEYARKGFFELVAVAGLSLLLIFVTERLLLRERETHDFKFKLLTGLLVAQVVIIMASAFKRLNLYEQAYGFTSSRLYGYVFIVWLAILFAVLLYKIFANRRESEFAFAVFVSLLLLVASFSFLNIDATVARKNIDRYEATGKLDVRYLETLSEDAIPQVTRLLDSEDTKLKNTIAASMYEKREFLRDMEEEGWQSYNLSRGAALDELDKHSVLLLKNKDHLYDPLYKGPGQQ